MSISEGDSCKVTWHIENFFYMCPQTCSRFLLGPTLTIGGFPQERKWELSIYPGGYEKEDYIACRLISDCEKDDDITTELSFTIISLYSSKDFVIKFDNETFNGDRFIAHYNILSKEELSKEENGYLPNGSLTLVCRIWKKGSKHDKSIAHSDLNPLRGDDYKSVNCDCMVVTTIHKYLMSLLWIVDDFNMLRLGETVKKIVKATTTSEFSLELYLCLMREPNDDQYVKIEVLRIMEGEQGNNFFIRGKIKTLGSPKDIQHEGRGEHYFGTSESVWKFPTFIKMADIRRENYLNYTNGVLYLLCEFTVTPKNCMYTTYEYKCKLKNRDANEHNGQCNCTFHPVLPRERNHFIRSGEVFQNLYSDGTFSDVIIRVGSHSFNVHKPILATRSPIFKDMFDADESVKESGIVDILDFDPDTMNRLLSFMYTEELEDLTDEAAIRLYSAADAYKFVLLKCRCRCILISLLCPCNVCDILCLAVAHRDDDLSRAVMNFLSNCRQIFQSQTWKEFTDKHSRIASNVMLCILSNNNSLSYE